MRHRTLAIATGAAAVALVVAATGLGAEPGEDLPVRRVILSSAGLAQIERGGVLAAGAAARFRAPTEDIDDILKSLIVADPAGSVEGVRLPAQDLAAEAFRGLPLRPDDFASRATLLNALRGHEAELGGVRGRIAEAAEAEHGTLRLALITPQGLRSLLAREGDEVRLVDAALAARGASRAPRRRWPPRAPRTRARSRSRCAPSVRARSRSAMSPAHRCGSRPGGSRCRRPPPLPAPTRPRQG